MIAIHVIITGRVQGVGYRAWTVRNAQALGLSGWVRNRRDGTVEAVFQGDETSVNDMLTRCKRGPLMARVEHIEKNMWNDSLDETGFTQNGAV